GRLTAKNAYARGEFLASSDERFRPVNLFSAPDGTLYVVDMYRGVVQDGGIWSDYLRDYIKSHDLELPVQRGRIWRIVYGTGSTKGGPKQPLPRPSRRRRARRPVMGMDGGETRRNGCPASAVRRRSHQR